MIIGGSTCRGELEKCRASTRSNNGARSVSPKHTPKKKSERRVWCFGPLTKGRLLIVGWRLETVRGGFVVTCRAAFVLR